MASASFADARFSDQRTVRLMWIAERQAAATYLVGFFSLSYMQMLALATPLWGDSIGLSVFMIGLASGARSVTPLVYAIHFGSLLDNVGARRFLILFSGQCALLPLLYPLLPFALPFLLFQLLLGLAAATAWLAAQTAIARVAAGDSTRTGRFSFFASAGTVVGPFALGLAWDRMGPAGGYGCLSAWGVALFAASIFLPVRRDVARQKINWGLLVPDWNAYFDSIIALKRPLVAFVMVCTFIRLSSVSMLESFFPLFLQMAGFSAAAVGALFAIGNLASLPASLLAARWVRLCGSAGRGLSVGVMLSVASLMIAPFLHNFWMIAAVVSLYGFGLGVTMPLIFTLLSGGVASDQQGSVAGLRATANRLAAVVLPLFMGLAAETFGIAGAFAGIGAALLLVLFAAERFIASRT